MSTACRLTLGPTTGPLQLTYGAFAPSPEWRAIFHGWGIALQEENWDVARDLLAADYLAVSHQLLEAGTDGLSRDQMIRMIQNLKSDIGDEVRLLVSEIHAGSDLGVVISEDFVPIDAEGWDISRGGVSMIQFGDGVMLRAERWDDIDLGAALARFDEIHVEAGLPPSERFSDPAKALAAGSPPVAT